MAEQRVFFLLLPQVHLLDLSGPAQVFDSANAQGASFRLHYLAENTTVQSAQGLILLAEAGWPTLHEDDLLIGPVLGKVPFDAMSA